MPGRFSRSGGAGDEPGDAPTTEPSTPASAEPEAEPATAVHEPVAADAPADQPTGRETPADPDPGPAAPGFAERGRLRRRLRQVRQLRELALRDLGGMVFDLHRFGRERPDLVTAKLDALAGLDAEMRTLEAILDERREVVVLHEAGLTACAACGTLLGSDARFCSNCATPVGEAPPAEVLAAAEPAPPPTPAEP